MFKLVVLCAFLAAAAAEPGALFGAPLLYSTSVVAPATTTITKSASSVVHPSPLYYSAPIAYSHYIKKRSAPLTLAATYAAPSAYITTPYVTPAYATSFYRAPLHAAPVLYSAPHFIKKRSAPIALASTYNYVAPTYATAPLLSTYATPYISHTPFISTAPFAYSQFIKK